MPITAGSGLRSQRSNSAAAAWAMPSVEEVEIRIARRDVAEAQVVAYLQRRRELHAARDRMVEPDLDQPLAHRKRNQALRRLTRNAELAGDLVLGVARDVIEPARARRLVQSQTVLVRLARHQTPLGCAGLRPPARISGSRAMSSKMRSAPAAVNSAACSGPEKWLPPTKPNTVIPAARAAADACDAVLDHQAIPGSRAHRARGEQEKVGMGLAPRNLGGREDVWREQRLVIGDAQSEPQPVGRARRGYADARL